MSSGYTENLSDFGHRELEEANKLTTAMKNGLPDDFDGLGVKLAFNSNSGFVFLTNAEYQVAMVDDKGKLYSFYTTPYEGYEGSLEELLEEYDNMSPDDQEYVDSIKESNGGASNEQH
tara:strand:+ start:108 stop:461 length:354 start_codon:yes stop_codon:yes gene_type:complete